MSIPVKTLANGFSLPVLGLGTWLFGGILERDENNDDEGDIAAIRHAIDAGLTHIDTAETYAAGHCEKLIGAAIKGYDRARLTLNSKVFRTNLHYADVLSSLESSLRRLDTPYLDTYYIHKPNHDIPFAETCKALNEAHRSRLIKNIAVCNALPATFDALQAHLDTPLVANQVHYSLMFREPEHVGLFEHAGLRDYLIVAWRPLLFSRNNDGVPDAWQKGAYPILDAMAEKYSKTNSQIALNWLIAQPRVTTIVKSSNPQHVNELVQAAVPFLTNEDIEILRAEFSDQKAVSNAVAMV